MQEITTYMLQWTFTDPTDVKVNNDAANATFPIYVSFVILLVFSVNNCRYVINNGNRFNYNAKSEDTQIVCVVICVLVQPKTPFWSSKKSLLFTIASC